MVGSFFFFLFLSMLPVCSEFNRGQNWGRFGAMGSLVLRWWEWKLVQPLEDIPALTPNTDKSLPSTSAPLYSPGRPVQESIRE